MDFLLDVLLDGLAVGVGGEAVGGVGFVAAPGRCGRGTFSLSRRSGSGSGLAVLVGDRVGVGVSDGQGVDDGVLDRLAVRCRSAIQTLRFLAGGGLAVEGRPDTLRGVFDQCLSLLLVELGELLVGQQRVRGRRR